MAHTFIIGSLFRPVVRCKAETTPGDGLGARTLTDPTTLQLKVRTPAGVETTYTYPATVTKRSTGIFYKDITIDAAGQWVARWIATGTVIDALEYVIEVPPSKLNSP